jgi:predicted nucleotidyltransferase
LLFVATPSHNAFMLAERPLPADLERRIRALPEVWGEDLDVAAVYLFGSRAGAHASPRSDVDIAVVYDELGWIEAVAEFAVVIERWIEEDVDRSSQPP